MKKDLISAYLYWFCSLMMVICVILNAMKGRSYMATIYIVFAIMWAVWGALMMRKYILDKRDEDKEPETFTIREIEERDNKQVEMIIRYCLTEYGASHTGTAWEDPDLGRFSFIYNTEGNKYWVAENSEGKVVGGVGIGQLLGADGVCELQKMYCLPEARGKGVAKQLMDIALDYATEYYQQCYLETLGNMDTAQRVYEKYGFYRIDEPLGNTGHCACDVLYLKDLMN